MITEQITGKQVLHVLGIIATAMLIVLAGLGTVIGGAYVISSVLLTNHLP